MPPRHTKSEFTSYLFPAWVMGGSSYEDHSGDAHAELAVGFGRKVKNLLDSEIYRDVFPQIELAGTLRLVVAGLRTKVVNTMLLV